MLLYNSFTKCSLCCWTEKHGGLIWSLCPRNHQGKAGEEKRSTSFYVFAIFLVKSKTLEKMKNKNIDFYSNRKKKNSSTITKYLENL